MFQFLSLFLLISQQWIPREVSPNKLGAEGLVRVRSITTDKKLKSGTFISYHK